MLFLPWILRSPAPHFIESRRVLSLLKENNISGSFSFGDVMYCAIYNWTAFILKKKAILNVKYTLLVLVFCGFLEHYDRDWRRENIFIICANVQRLVHGIQSKKTEEELKKTDFGVSSASVPKQFWYYFSTSPTEIENEKVNIFSRCYQHFGKISASCSKNSAKISRNTAPPPSWWMFFIYRCHISIRMWLSSVWLGTTTRGTKCIT